MDLARGQPSIPPVRVIERATTFIGTTALVGLTVLVLGLAIGYLLDALDYYERRADAQLMWFASATMFVLFLFYSAIVGSLAAAVVKLPGRRPNVLLLAGAVTSAVGLWAVARNSGNVEFETAAWSSVVVGLCALMASIALNSLRLRGDVKVSASGREPDWPHAQI